MADGSCKAEDDRESSFGLTTPAHGFREPHQIWWLVAQPFRSYIGAKNAYTFV
eukprot:COSAG02_NODE_3992_length_5942_cov_4.028239_5_plen_53_part_00